MPKIVITLPAYRAESTLERTVADIPEGVADLLILVDDASPDGTVRKARELGVHVVVHDENRGYGGNQKTCYTEALAAGADVVVLLHPDYQYDPKAVPLLIAPILAGDADMTFGSRFAGLGNPRAGGMPLYRFVGNRITTMLENLMLGARFTDLHSGMRAYTRECLLSVPFLSFTDDFAFDTQFLVDAVTTGQRVVEVPIPTRYSKESSSIQVGASLRYIASSLAHTARRTAVRGRQGRRWPVTLQGLRRGPLLGTSAPAPARTCVLCGSREHLLVYPANAGGDVAVDEFACTTDALGVHDDILQCTRCGLVSSASPLEDRELIERYEQVVDEDYLSEEAGRRELFDWIVGRMGGFPVRGRRLLEVGANVGLFLDEARERGWQVQGIEPSRWAVERGRERFGVDLRQGTVEELDVVPGSSDAVVMLDVLEHLGDPVAALRTLRPALDDEGLLVLSTVDLSGRHARMRGADWPWFIRSHLWFFTPETLTAMLRQTGFRLVHWEHVPRDFHLSYLAHRIGEPRGGVGRAAGALARVIDPRIPTGWLQDVALAIARPI